MRVCRLPGASLAMPPVTMASRHHSPIKPHFPIPRLMGKMNTHHRRTLHNTTPDHNVPPKINSKDKNSKTNQPLHSLPATFVRSGTSNGLLLHAHHLPQDPTQWPSILPALMGSPDPHARQLDGLGSGLSSTSKICIVQRSEREAADLDFTFVQVGIVDGALDTAGNCGNMSAVVGPWGWDEGLVAWGGGSGGEGGEAGWRTVRVFNTNTRKTIHATFAVSPDGTAYDPSGEYSIDGVPGTGSRITLEFLDPAGAKTGKVLPTGRPVDVIQLADGSEICASLVDVANPGVFVLADDVGVPGDVSPAALARMPAVMRRLEEIRGRGAEMMGLDPRIQSVPKIVLVSRPTERAMEEEGVHIVCRALSMQQPHKAVPLTLALNLGTAVRMPGTVPAMAAVNSEGRETVTIAHASGRVEVGSVFEDGKIKSALLHRTARVLMKGDVFYYPAET